MSNNPNIPEIPVQWHNDLVRARKAASAAKKRADEVKAKIIERIGPGRIGRIRGAQGAYVLLATPRGAYTVKPNVIDELRHTVDLAAARAKLRPKRK